MVFNNCFTKIIYYVIFNLEGTYYIQTVITNYRSLIQYLTIRYVYRCLYIDMKYKFQIIFCPNLLNLLSCGLNNYRLYCTYIT